MSIKENKSIEENKEDIAEKVTYDPKTGAYASFSVPNEYKHGLPVNESQKYKVS